MVHSEALGERPDETFAVITDFLGVERWRPSEYSRAHGSGESDLDEATRERLEAFYEPHRQKLAALLGD